MSNEKDQANLIPGSAPPPPPATSGPGLNGYPTVPPGFPPHTQAGPNAAAQPPPPYSQYPGQPFPPQMAFYHPGMMAGPMGFPPGAQLPPPPPYDPQQGPPQQQMAPPQFTPYAFHPGQPIPAYPTPYGMWPANYQTGPYQIFPMMHHLPPNMAVVMPDGFDPSARFDGVSRPSVPPPPPGVAPNMAQQALMYGQGNQVIVGQKKAGFF